MKYIFYIFVTCIANLSFGQPIDDITLKKDLVGVYEDAWTYEDKMLNVKYLIPYRNENSYKADNIYECSGDMKITVTKGKTTAVIVYVFSATGKYRISKSVLIVDCPPDNISFTPKFIAVPLKLQSVL